MKSAFPTRVLMTILCFASCTQLIAQVHMPGPRYTAEEIRERNERTELEKKCAQAQYAFQLQQAEELGKDISLTISLDTSVVEVPGDIREQIAAYEASRRRHDDWMRQWRGLANAELKRRQNLADETSKPANVWAKPNRATIFLRPERLVPLADAIEQIGPRPDIALLPPRPVKPGMVLVFENVADHARRIYSSRIYRKPGYRINEKCSGDGIKRQLCNTAIGECNTLQDSNEGWVDLAPGETLVLRLHRGDTRFPFYFEKPGTYRFEVEFLSGVTPRGIFVAHTDKLEDDAMVMKSVPIEFKVELN